MGLLIEHYICLKNRLIYFYVFKVLFVECNFYAGGGSKLKATAEEYEKLGQSLKLDNFNFIWITDGAGWLTTKIPLQKAFENIDYLINLQMVEDGILQQIIK